MHWHNLPRSYRSQGHVFRIISCLNQVLFAWEVSPENVTVSYTTGSDTESFNIDHRP